jgi:hypothetical protein
MKPLWLADLSVPTTNGRTLPRSDLEICLRFRKPLETASRKYLNLVEHRSLPGYSGSPVFIVLDPTLPRPPMWMSPFDSTYHRARHGPWLLGIDSFHMHHYEKVLKDDQSTPAEPRQWVRANAGMAGVIPAWRLLSLLNCDDLQLQREKDDREITQKRTELQP